MVAPISQRQANNGFQAVYKRLIRIEGAGRLRRADLDQHEQSNQKRSEKSSFAVPDHCPHECIPHSKMSDCDALLRSYVGFWPPAILHVAAAFRPEPIQNFSVVRGLGTWHCLPAGQPGHNGVPAPFFSGTGVRVRGRRVIKHRQKGRGRAQAKPEMLLKLELQSNPEALCLVRAAVERAAEVVHFQAADARAIVRSVDEALANVMRHAYGGRPGLPIEMSCYKLPLGERKSAQGGIEILLADRGVPVKPATLKSRPLDEIRPGGLGLHFIRQSMDEVEFSRKNGKNLLRMVKYLLPTPQAAASEGE